MKITIICVNFFDKIDKMSEIIKNRPIVKEKFSAKKDAPVLRTGASDFLIINFTYTWNQVRFLCALLLRF